MNDKQQSSEEKTTATQLPIANARNIEMLAGHINDLRKRLAALEAQAAPGPEPEAEFVPGWVRFYPETKRLRAAMQFENSLEWQDIYLDLTSGAETVWLHARNQENMIGLVLSSEELARHIGSCIHIYQRMMKGWVAP